MKKIAIILTMVGFTYASPAVDQFFAGDGTGLATAKWANTSGGPFTDAFVAGSVANFATVSGTGTGGTISVGGLVAAENFTLTAASGTIGNEGNGIVSINVASGKLLDFNTQSFTTSATAGYTKDGAGAVALAGNTYGGGFTLNAGTVIVRGINAMGAGVAGTLVINGGAIGANASRDLSGKFPGGVTVGGDFQIGVLASAISLASDTAVLTINNNINLGAATRTITIGNNATHVLSGIISGNSGVGLTVGRLGGATGTLSLTGNSTFDGGLVVNSGIVSLSGAKSYSGGTTINTGAQLTIANDTAQLGVSTSPITLAGGTFFRGAQTTATLPPLDQPIVLTENSTISGNPTAGNSRRITFNTSSFTLTSGKTLTLRSTAGGRLDVRFTGGGYTWNEPLVIGLAGDSGLVLFDVRSEISGTGDQTFNGQISGTGIFSRNVVGATPGATTFINNSSNSYSGGTHIRAGYLALGADNCLGTGALTFGWDPNALGIYANGAARLLTNNVIADVLNTLNSASSAAGSTNLHIIGSQALTLSGRLFIHTNFTRLTVSNTALTTFSGNITNASTFAVGLVKWGAGTVVFSGDNTYSGTTTVGEGTLLINNLTGSGTSSGAVTVQSGATLGGTGTIGGSVAVNDGGTMGAGASAGILTLNNGLDLSAGGTNVWELAANSTSNPGTDFDQISLTGGNLVLGGSSRLQINFIGAATYPDATNAFWQQARSWLIIDGSGSAANPGSTTFATIEGVTGNNAGTFSTQADASGNVTLTFTPNGTSAPEITSFAVVGGDFIFSGTNGTAGNPYVVVSSTNVAMPLVNWTPEITNTFGVGGSFSFTNTIVPGVPEKFFRVQLQ